MCGVMKISQKGLYALQAMMMLARRYRQGAIKIREVAYEENLPEKFLELILLELKNARMVESVRGAKGGYQLRRDPADIRLSEIIRLIDGPLAPFGDAEQLRALIDRDLPHRALYQLFLDVRDAAAQHPGKYNSGRPHCRPGSARHQGQAHPLRRKEKRASCPWSSGDTRVYRQLLVGIMLRVVRQRFRLRRKPPFAWARSPTSPTPKPWWVKRTDGSTKRWARSVKVQWTSFNAGPSAIEALFGGAIDMTYVGPNPAINGYVRSNGEALRVVAGAASGGASLVVRNDSGIQKPEDFHGKRVASPQFGNTQDVALRNWLKSHGMKTNDKGGDVQVIPMANPDQLTLFLKKELDAAWAPEPWATRLIHEGNGRLFVDERTLWPNGQFVIGLLVVHTKFLHEHSDLVKKWIRANVELTDWINGSSCAKPRNC